MTYTVEVPLGWPLPKRYHFLEELKEEKGNYAHKLSFQNRTITLQVYPVPIDLPKYRLANGRTQAAQEEYLANHPDFPADFFSRDKESDEAQAVQHKLLSDLLETPTVNLLSYFKSNQQTEPLILSNEGYVVNGNRRLCAIRLLHFGDKEKFPHFSHVDVVVLPRCDDKDIDELEAHLQIQPDIKQEYTWITTACMLRARQGRHGYSYKDLASLYDIPQKKVREYLDLLAHVDDYLRDRGKEKQYHLVEKDEFAFKKLKQGRNALKKSDEKDLFTQLSYLLIDGTEIEGRLYDRIPNVKDYLPQISAELAEQLPVETANDETVEEEYDLFGSHSSPLAPLVEVVKKPEHEQEVIEIIQDVIEREERKQKEKKKANYVLTEVRSANTSLKNATNCIDSESETKGLKEQLDSIERSVKKLREWLAEHA